jgi:OOP family OmpA-OmpF porin
MKHLRRYLIAGATLLSPFSAGAMDLHLPPGAALTMETSEAFGSYDLPTSGWANGTLASKSTEGAILQQAWRVNSTNLTTLQLLDTLRNQLSDKGFAIDFECDAVACGGFDFRFNTAIIPEPAMHVDLGDFRFLAAHRIIADRSEYISLVVSRSSAAGFIQLVHVGDTDSAPLPLSISTKGARADEPLDLGALPSMLEETGHFVLADLAFATGSSTLDGAEFASLAALADYLNRNPTRTVALVGHTDAEGSLEGNVVLSKQRARAVAATLVNTHGVNVEQVSAEGMGFLAPRASNLTEEGRTINRRVEVILTSTSE